MTKKQKPTRATLKLPKNIKKATKTIDFVTECDSLNEI